MNTRKIVLLAAFAFLLAVCIIQTITGAISPVKTVKTDGDLDAVTITKDGTTVELVKKENRWFVGKDNYIANSSDVNAILKAIQEVKVLDKVGRAGNADNDEKYSLTEPKATIVKAYKSGKEVMRLMIGKTTSTGAQTYACVAGKKEINLVSGNLTSTFGKSENELKGKTVYSIEEKEISGATVSMDKLNWSLSKVSKKNEPVVWTINGNPTEIELDNSVANSWIQNVAFMNITSWIDDNTLLPENKAVSFQLNATGETVSVDLYEVKTDGETKYYGTCSRTPHKFELSKTQAEKFLKNYEDFKQN